jgi:hypothetical protein
MTPTKVDHTNTRCCICGGSETYIYQKKPEWYSRDCTKKDCTGYICSGCYRKDYDRNNPYSKANLIKYMRDIRTGNLRLSSETGMGFIAEVSVAKARGAKNCNIESDNFNSRYDIEDPYLGRLQVKSPYLEKSGRCTVEIGMEHNFDTLFISCMDKGRNNMIRIYIIPESELYGETGIVIHEDFSKTTRLSKFEWIERYRVDEKNKDIYDKFYHDLISYIGDRKFFGIEDIKKWLSI